MQISRASGILAHITSLPSPYGIGDIGTAGYAFVDFLAKARQRYWQFLPTGPTSSYFDDSPYMSFSAFAGSFLLISPDLLYEDGLISRSSLDKHPDFSPYLTDFSQVRLYKQDLLREAFEKHSGAPTQEYADFISEHAWLFDYAVFMTAKSVYKEKAWSAWPKALALHSRSGIDSFAQKNRTAINYYLFEQFIFHQQWHRLKAYAEKNDVKLFGDLPIYVAYDSVDAWVHRSIFDLDPSTLQPVNVSGVPPDYFSSTGQKWGNPLYRWDSVSEEITSDLMTWWTERFKHLFTLVHTVRIDHFRGFESYWSVPEANATAIEGTWLKGPGAPFFKELELRLGKLEIVAEDLGIITEDVVNLREELGFPGMKVLQFAFDGNTDNAFLPSNYTSPNCVVYTGTHDNDTTLGWYLSDKLDDATRTRVKKIANRNIHDASPIHKDMIYLAQSSIANMAIIPLQDALGFGNDCKMNTPGTAKGNWRWRCSSEFLTDNLANELAESTSLFGRDNMNRDSKKIREISSAAQTNG